MKLRGGEFSTGTVGTFQPELTVSPPCLAGWTRITYVGTPLNPRPIAYSLSR